MRGGGEDRSGVLNHEGHEGHKEEQKEFVLQEETEIAEQDKPTLRFLSYLLFTPGLYSIFVFLVSFVVPFLKRALCVFA